MGQNSKIWLDGVYENNFSISIIFSDFHYMKPLGISII